MILATDMSSHFDLTKDIDASEKQDDLRRNHERNAHFGGDGHRLRHGDGVS